MRSTVIAERYAQALLEAAGDRAGTLMEEMAGFSSEDIEHLTLFLTHPRVPKERKKALIASISGSSRSEENAGQPDGLLSRLLRLLVDKGRVGYLADIFRVYPNLYRKRQGILSGHLTVAHPVADFTLNGIRYRFEGLLGCSLELTVREDPAILGGFVFSTGTVLADASIKRQLERLSERLQLAPLN